ncbi:hypothetical protein [Micromonospora sp. LOL_023]|uniref:hypothetical protein n=1 Tax=Micromonospora sp. LOL_023 TaxID=3345418 RepID=UPI003A8B0045
MHDGFDKAGDALTAYADAQSRALVRFRDGVAAENALGVLIADVAATQSIVVLLSDPLRQWNDLRSVTGALDFVAEIGHQDVIERIRLDADRLWALATVAYDDAARIETTARRYAVDQLERAYRLLPDFLANSEVSAQIVGAVIGEELAAPGSRYHRGPPESPTLRFDDDFPYDPTATATPADYASWNKWRGMLRAAQAARPDLDDATATYAHYMSGLGTDFEIDYEEAYREDPMIAQVVDGEIAAAQLAAEQIYLRSGDTSFQLAGDPVSAAESIGGQYPASTENWQKAIGDHTVYGTSEVVVVGDQATMRIVVHAEDMYNFNADAADIATGAPDAENGRFSTLGWAQQFRTYGEVERTVSWTIGDAPGATVTTPSGPQRNAPGEDRVDGIADG